MLYYHPSRLAAIPFEQYPDGLPLLRSHALDINHPPTGHRLVVRWQHDDNPGPDLLRLLCLSDTTQLHRLVVPYVPGARQDRTNLDGDVLTTARAVCRAINSLNTQVSVLDPHSDVVPALLERCRTHTAADVVRTYVDQFAGYVGVIAPDAGAVRRARAVARVLGVPCVEAGKHRDTSTGKLTGFHCPFLEHGRWLVVDDICDGGGTFIGLADVVLATNVGVQLDLYVSHGLFTQGLDGLLARFGTVLTTDSVAPTALPNSRFTILPYCTEHM